MTAQFCLQQSPEN